MNRPTPIEELFFAASERPDSTARAAYLDEACGRDTDLRRRVEDLLAAEPKVSQFLESPAVTAPIEPDPVASDESPGTVIGPYKLLEQIGEGGMGVVFVAEQAQPVRRNVALKIIKPGMDTKQVIARFEAERQALAMMDHPNIAKVHDAGATETGRPYFVMELVRGIPITDYCDREQLAIPDRLELFVLVCWAVQHAHQKGIIHRDLKPSNILVTLIDGVAVPKVIDFGVAKATGAALTQRTIYTTLHQFIGTPLYMSPEQADLSGMDMDTRSDIYSLGVLLYELLTGTTPFDQDTFRTAAFDELRRIIREEEPPKPSTRLSSLGATRTTVSTNRKAAARHLDRTVRGELDWIVMKALEKDRRRRYETANDFAADVMRYLTDKPVEACPPSAWYRFAKFTRRNRAALATAAVLSTALVAGVTVSAWQAVRATQAESKARARAEEARLVLDYLVEDVFGAARPEKTRGRTLTVQELLARGEEAIPARFSGRPLVEASARQAMGEVFVSLGRIEEAQRQFRRAAEIRAALLGPEHPDTLTAEGLLVQALSGEHFIRYKSRPEVEPLARRVLEVRRRVLGPEHPATLLSMTELAQALRTVNKYPEALDLFQRAYVLQARVFGPEDHETLRNLAGVAGALHDLHRFVESEAVLRRLLDTELRVFGPDDEKTLTIREQLAGVLYQQGRLDEAIPLGQEALEGLKRIWGPTHPYIANRFSVLAGALRQKHDWAALRDLYEGWLRECLAAPIDPDLHQRQRLSIHISQFVSGLTTLPRSIPFDADLAVRAVGQLVVLGEQNLAESTARSGPDHDETLECMSILADAYESAGKLDREERLLRELLELRRRKDGPKSAEIAGTLAMLGFNLLKQAEYAKAEPFLRECLAIREQQFADDWPRFNALSMLGGALLGQQKYAEAEPLLLQGYEGMKQRETKIPHEPAERRLPEAVGRIVRLYELTNQKEKARAWHGKL